MSRPQRACRQPHGTVARYVAGCSCIRCCDAWADYNRDPRQHAVLDPAPVRQHVKRLLRTLTLREVAERAGLDRKTIRAFRDGSRPTVRRATAEAVLGVTARDRSAA